MKTKKSKEEAAAPMPKGKVKIKNLKLARETVQNLPDADAGAVKGGATSTRYTGSDQHNETFVCDGEDEEL